MFAFCHPSVAGCPALRCLMPARGGRCGAAALPMTPPIGHTQPHLALPAMRMPASPCGLRCASMQPQRCAADCLRQPHACITAASLSHMTRDALQAILAGCLAPAGLTAVASPLPTSTSGWAPLKTEVLHAAAVAAPLLQLVPHCAQPPREHGLPAGRRVTVTASPQRHAI